MHARAGSGVGIGSRTATAMSAATAASSSGRAGGSARTLHLQSLQAQVRSDTASSTSWFRAASRALGTLPRMLMATGAFVGGSFRRRTTSTSKSVIGGSGSLTVAGGGNSGAPFSDHKTTGLASASKQQQPQGPGGGANTLPLGQGVGQGVGQPVNGCISEDEVMNESLGSLLGQLVTVVGEEHPAEDRVLAFRGLRVRMGMHAGIEEVGHNKVRATGRGRVRG